MYNVCIPCLEGLSPGITQSNFIKKSLFQDFEESFNHQSYLRIEDFHFKKYKSCLQFVSI